MKSFMDTKNRQWNLAVTVSSVKRVRELLDVDILGLLDDDNKAVLRALSTDDIMMVNVIFAIIKPQADELGIDDVDFGECMAGDAIANAYIAFTEELANFSRNPNTRRLLGKALAKVTEVQDKLAGIAEARIDSGEIDRIVDNEVKRIQTAGGEPSGSSQA